MIIAIHEIVLRGANIGLSPETLAHRLMPAGFDVEDNTKKPFECAASFWGLGGWDVEYRSLSDQ